MVIDSRFRILTRRQMSMAQANVFGGYNVRNSTKSSIRRR